MKTNRILTLLSLFAFIFVLTSCVEDDDFNLPNLEIVDPNINSGNITTFKAIISRYETENYQLTTFDLGEDDIYIEGYVISNDQGGNFYEELVIQNKTDDSTSPEDPRLGFRVDINQGSLSDTYEVGRRVYIKMNGLSFDESNGVYVIGKAETGGDLGQIPSNEYLDHVIRGPEVATMVPKVLTMGEFSDDDENTFVQFENAQILKNELGLTYAGEDSDFFDGLRTIETCEEGNNSTITLQTSTFADFKSLALPQQSGTIQGVFTKNFSGNTNVLVINSISDVNFDNPERCDPFDVNDFNIVFEELFDSAIDNTNLDIADWTNFAEAGGELWTEQVYSGNGYAEFSSYFSGDDDNIGWLVSPGLDMDAQENESLNFDTAQHHLDSEDNTLEIFLSTDFDGTDVLGATWESIDVNIATIDDSWYNFINSGLIDVSSYTGTLYVAFKVTGSGTDTELDGAFHIENFRLVTPL